MTRMRHAALGALLVLLWGCNDQREELPSEGVGSLLADTLAGGGESGDTDFGKRYVLCDPSTPCADQLEECIGGVCTIPCVVDSDCDDRLGDCVETVTGEPAGVYDSTTGRVTAAEGGSAQVCVPTCSENSDCAELEGFECSDGLCSAVAADCCVAGDIEACGLCGERVCESRCAWGECVGCGETIVADFTTDFSPAGACNLDASAYLFVGRVDALDGNVGTFEFQRCDGSAFDESVQYWVAVGDQFPDDSRINSFVPRLSGAGGDASTILLDGNETLRVSGVPVWLDVASFSADPCGEEKDILLITDDPATPGQRRWIQFQSVTFTKVCE